MTATLVQIAVGVILGILTALVRGPKPATHEQPRRTELKERLLSKIRRAGWCIACATLLQGCGIFQPQTAIYVPSGEPVRIAEDIRGATVEVIGPDGTTLRRMDIPAGWYALPDDNQ